MTDLTTAQELSAGVHPIGSRTPASPEARYVRQLARFAQHAIASGYDRATSCAVGTEGTVVRVCYSMTADEREYVCVYFGTEGNVLIAEASSGAIVDGSESIAARSDAALALFMPMNPWNEDEAAVTAMFDEHVDAPAAPSLAELADCETTTESWSASDLARTTALLDLIEGYETEVANNTRRRTNFELGQMMSAQRFAVDLRAFGVDHGILDPADGPSDAEREAL